MEPKNKTLIFSFVLFLIFVSCNLSKPTNVQNKTALQVVAKNDFFELLKAPIPKIDKNILYLYPSESLLIDYNNDKHKDLLLFGLKNPQDKNSSDSPVYLLKNNGDGFFSNVTQEVLGQITSVHARSFYADDFNNDGFQDFIISDHGADELPFHGGISKVVINNEGTSFKIAKQFERAFTFFSCVSDVNQDGLKDIFLSNLKTPSSSKGSKLYLQQKDGTFMEDNKRLPLGIQSNDSGFLACLFLDYDNDGDEDLYLGGPDGKEGSVPSDLILQNDGGYLNQKILTLPKRYKNSTWGTVDAKAIDIDNDGFVDIVSSVHNYGFSEGAIQIYKNIKGKNFISDDKIVLTFPDKSNFWIPWIVSTDINNDKLIDLVIALRHGSHKTHSLKNSLELFINKNNFNYVNKTELLPLNNIFFSSVNEIDYNLDGRYDLILTDYNKNYYLLKNLMGLTK